MGSTRAKLSAVADMAFVVALAIPSNGQKVAPAQVEKAEIVLVGTAVKAGAVLVRAEPRYSAQQKKEAMRDRKAVGDSELRGQIQAADLVVVGTVKEVRAAAIPAAAPESTPVTEHDPRWQEAIIHSDSVIKGPSTGKDFIVHFPASVDVAWYEAPKLKPGQAGIFLLKQDTVSGAPTVMFQNKRVQAYTVLNPGAVLGKEEAQRVRSLAVK